MKYVSADDAWAEFQKEYFGDNPELAEGFKDDNPLAGSDNYEVYMKTVKGDNKDLIAKSKSLSATQQDLVKFAQSLDGVRQVNKSDVVANTLSSVNMLVAYVSIAIIAILLGVSIFLISNTVTTGITVKKRRDCNHEIYWSEGLCSKITIRDRRSDHWIIRCSNSACPAIFPYDKAVVYIMEKFSILKNIITFLPVGNVYIYLLPIGLVMGIGIGFLGSYFTVRKHLRV